MSLREANILKGVLGPYPSGMNIAFTNGEFELFVHTPIPDDIEVLCRHAEWDQFIELVAEYSDYVEGDT